MNDNQLNFISHYLDLLHNEPYLFRTEEMAKDFYNFILEFSEQVDTLIFVDPGTVWSMFKQTYPEHFQIYRPYQYFPEEDFIPELDEFIDFDDMSDKDIGYLNKSLHSLNKPRNIGNLNKKIKKFKSKYKGLSPTISGTWRARFQENKREYNIGSFKTEREALKAYNNVVLELGYPEKFQKWKGPSTRYR